MLLQLKTKLNFMMMTLKKKCSKDWLNEIKFRPNPNQPSKGVKYGSSRQPKRLQRKLLKLSLRQAPWHLWTAICQIKDNNNNSKVSNQLRNQNKSKFTRRKNKNLSSQTRSKSSKEERKDKSNLNFKESSRYKQ